MNTNYFYELRGDYNIASQRIRLNYGNLIADPIQTRLTLIHEWTHSLLAENDFGQLSYCFANLITHFNHLSKNEISQIEKLIYDSQHFVQEGFATLMQYSSLYNSHGKKVADEWSNTKVNQIYKNYLDQLKFICDLSLEERELFTGKISYLAMETGIRKELPKRDLLRSADALQKYLSEPDNNPDHRLEKIIKAVKEDPMILNLGLPEIAQKSQITYFIPTSKEEVVTFLNYISSHTSNPPDYTLENVKDSPSAELKMMDSWEDMVVANLSTNFADSSDIVDVTSFLHYSDQMEVVIAISHRDDWQYWEFIRSKLNLDPEIGLIGILPTGEKYITYTSKEEASELINNNLNDLTFAINWGEFNAITSKVMWSDNIRLPDLVLYNTVKDMRLMLEAVAKSSPGIKFKHLHAGVMENHPLQSLWVLVGDNIPLHIVNHLHNRYILECIKIIKERSLIIDESY